MTRLPPQKPSTEFKNHLVKQETIWSKEDVTKVSGAESMFAVIPLSNPLGPHIVSCNREKSVTVSDTG